MPDVFAMFVTGLLDGASLREICSVETLWSCAQWWAASTVARETIAWVRG